MGREAINPPTLGTPLGHFSRAVRIGNIIHVTGTSAVTHLSGPRHSRSIPPSIEEQVELTFQNIGKALDGCGAGLSDIYRMFIIVKDPEYINVVNAARRRLFPDPKYVSTSLVADMMRDEMLVEIEVSAILPD